MVVLPASICAMIPKFLNFLRSSDIGWLGETDNNALIKPSARVNKSPFEGFGIIFGRYLKSREIKFLKYSSSIFPISTFITSSIVIITMWRFL